MATGHQQIDQAPEQQMPSSERLHALSIKELAQELALPLENVTAVYEAVLREMLADARIADYLPILAAKRVRARYKNETRAQ